MYPKIIYQSWKSHNIPDKCKTWVQSWKDHNPDYEYILWDDQENHEFVKTYFPQYLEVYEGFPREIFRCDFVRHLFLYKYGGIYADLDFECLRPFDPLLEENDDVDILLGELVGLKIYKIPNAIMISKPGNKFWLDVCDRIVALYHHCDKDNFPIPEFITGPMVLEKTYHEKERSDIRILPPEDFYQVNFLSWQWKGDKDKFKKAQRDAALNNGGYAVTYWMSSWIYPGYAKGLYKTCEEM